MSNDQQNPNSQIIKKQYDFGDRTIKFSLAVIEYCRFINKDNINQILINQLVRSATSIGANYSEADEAISNRDFINKLAIAKKEAKETKYWLHLLAETIPNNIETARSLWQEANELTKILATIINNSKNKQRKGFGA